MPKFTVELVANALVRYSIEVEAEDEESAEAKAIDNAPTRVSYWDLCENDVTDIDVTEVKETEEEAPSTTDPNATEDIEAWLRGQDTATVHGCSVFYEHGQHYVSCLDCGASWSVVDSEPGTYSLEQLDNGDESCFSS